MTCTALAADLESESEGNFEEQEHHPMHCNKLFPPPNPQYASRGPRRQQQSCVTFRGEGGGATDGILKASDIHTSTDIVAIIYRLYIHMKVYIHMYMYALISLLVSL